MFYCLCDEGDGVLIPAPYYPAFDNDLQAGPWGWGSSVPIGCRLLAELRRACAPHGQMAARMLRRQHWGGACTMGQDAGQQTVPAQRGFE